MKTLGTLTSFRKTKKYLYGLTDLEKTVNGVTYRIAIDPIYSGKKTTQGGSKTSDPKDVKFYAGVKYEGGSYTIKRNLSTKSEAKNILQGVMNKVSDETSKTEIRNVLVKLSKSS